MNATTRRRRKQRMPKRGGKPGKEENQGRASRKRKWGQRNNDLAEEKEQEEDDSEEAEVEWEEGKSGRLDGQPFDVGATMEDFAYQELLNRQKRMGQGSSSSRPNRERRIQEIHADNETPIESMPISIRAGIAARKSAAPKHLRLRAESVLANKDPDERGNTVASAFNVDIKQHHIAGLCPGKWLNDELINFYFQLLHQYDRQLATLDPTRVLSVFASSFYFSKLVENGVYDYGRIARWNKNQRFFQSQYVFFPVNINNAHWVLVVADVPQHTLTLYDSLPGMVRWSRVLPFLVNALEERYRQEEEGREDPTPWRLFTYHGINQENGNDCGLYTIMTANLLLSGLPVATCTLSPDCAKRYRHRVASQILEVDLGYPFFDAERKVVPAPPVPPLPPIVPFLPHKIRKLQQQKENQEMKPDPSDDAENLVSDEDEDDDFGPEQLQTDKATTIIDRNNSALIAHPLHPEIIHLVEECVRTVSPELDHHPEIVVFGKVRHQQRSIAFYSDSSIGYKYSNQIAKSKPLHACLRDLLDFVNTKFGYNFNGILVNFYESGDEYIGRHSDDEQGLDKRVGVVAMSYGAIRKFRIREKTTGNIVADVPTDPNFMLQMCGDFQQHFTHEIPVEKTIRQPRFSFTFRHHTI